MKEIKKILLAGVLAGVATLFGATAQAGLKTNGSGESTTIDIAEFPPEMAVTYKIMAEKCTRCHSLERTVVAIQTGLGPVSGNIFDKSSTEAYGVKMMRMPDAGLTKEELKKVVDLLNYLIDLAAK